MSASAMYCLTGSNMRVKSKPVSVRAVVYTSEWTRMSPTERMVTVETASSTSSTTSGSSAAQPASRRVRVNAQILRMP